MSRIDLSGQIALVTGVSRGIGRAIALAVGAAGAHVICVARTEGALEEIDDIARSKGWSATLVPLDVTDQEGIDRLGGAIFERWGRLDIFVANAAILGPLSPAGHISPKEWNAVMAVNLSANWRFIRALDPLLRASKGARAVFVSSGAAHVCAAYTGAYAASKAGLEALVRVYAAEMQHTKVRVNLLNPGHVRTAMRARFMPGEDPSTLPVPPVIAAAMMPLVAQNLEHTGRLYRVDDKGTLVLTDMKAIPST